MSIHVTNLLEFKNQKTTKKCDECQKEVNLKVYRTALYKIMDILLELPIKV